MGVNWDISMELGVIWIWDITTELGVNWDISTELGVIQDISTELGVIQETTMFIRVCIDHTICASLEVGIGKRLVEGTKGLGEGKTFFTSSRP